MVEWAEVFDRDYAGLRSKLKKCGDILSALAETPGPFRGTNGKQKQATIEAAESLSGHDENAASWLRKQRELDEVYSRWVVERRREFFENHPEMAGWVTTVTTLGDIKKAA